MVDSAVLPLICLKKVQKLGHLIIHSEVFVAFYCYMEVFLLHNSSKTSLQCSWSFRDPTFYSFLLDKCENYSRSIRDVVLFRKFSLKSYEINIIQRNKLQLPLLKTNVSPNKKILFSISLSLSLSLSPCDAPKAKQSSPNNESAGDSSNLTHKIKKRKQPQSSVAVEPKSKTFTSVFIYNLDFFAFQSVDGTFVLLVKGTQE